MHPSDSMVNMIVLRRTPGHGWLIQYGDLFQAVPDDPTRLGEAIQRIVRGLDHPTGVTPAELRTFHAADQLGQPLNAESVDGDGGRPRSPLWDHMVRTYEASVEVHPQQAPPWATRMADRFNEVRAAQQGRCTDEWQPTHAAGSRPQQCATCSPSCAHPWHSTTTLDGEPIETTCPQCGDRA